MTNHLDEAANKAVELAEVLAGAPSERQRVHASAHLTYLAGLIRGGAVREVTTDHGPTSDWWQEIITRAGVLRATDGRQVWPPPACAEDADPGDRDLHGTTRERHLLAELAKTRNAAKVAEGERDEALAKLAQWGPVPIELEQTRRELNRLREGAAEVVKYWTDWSADRRQAVRDLSSYLGAALDDLVVGMRPTRADPGDHDPTENSPEGRANAHLTSALVKTRAQRDDLLQAARTVLDDPELQYTELEPLEQVVKRIEQEVQEG